MTVGVSYNSGSDCSRSRIAAYDCSGVAAAVAAADASTEMRRSREQQFVELERLIS